MKFSEDSKTLKKQFRLNDGNIYENCYISDKKLISRPGAVGNSQNKIFFNDGSMHADVSFVTTDNYLYYDGRYGRLVMDIHDNLRGNVMFMPRLVFEDGSLEDLGYIEFTAVTAGVFGYPSAYTMFSGNALRGKGIFFMVRQEYGEGYEDFVKVFELTDSGWMLLNENDFYTPTVYAYGRGDQYNLAMMSMIVGGFPEPVYLEGRNLLSSGFACLYTTDYQSFSFTLPVNNLDNSYVLVDLSVSTGNYRFIIPADAENSSPVTVDINDVVAIVDRSAGRVTLRRSDGVEYAPENCGKYNNLRIEAFKTDEAAKIKLASKTSSARISSSHFDGNSDTTLFYGGSLCPAEVYWNSPHHPLYFSENNRMMLGDSRLEVLKVVSKDNTVVAFKENKAFSATLSAVSNKNSGENRKDSFSLKFEPKYTLSEKPLKNTVISLPAGIYYTSYKGNIFLLGSEEPKYSQEVNEDSFATVFKGRYLLVSENKAVLFDGKEGFNWTFPANMVGGFEHLGNSVLFARIRTENLNVVYPLKLLGDTDVFYEVAGDSLAERVKKVTGALEGELFEGSYEKIFLNRLKVSAVSDGKGEICLKNGEEELFKTGFSYNGQRGFVTAGVIGDELKVRLSFTGEFKLKGITAEYRHSNKM